VACDLSERRLLINDFAGALVWTIPRIQAAVAATGLHGLTPH
jgi:hypothetical protein